MNNNIGYNMINYQNENENVLQDYKMIVVELPKLFSPSL